MVENWAVLKVGELALKKAPPTVCKSDLQWVDWMAVLSVY
jgi:hypothetical protein